MATRAAPGRGFRGAASGDEGEGAGLEEALAGEAAAQFHVDIVHGVGGAGGSGTAADGAGDVLDAEGAGDFLDQIGLAGEILAEGGDEPARRRAACKGRSR